MNPRVISESTTEPITLAEAILNAGAFTDASDVVAGSRMSQIIKTARQIAEEECDLSLVMKTLEWSQEGLAPARIELPKGPVRSVISVRYLDPDGVDTLLAADQYRFSVYEDATVLIPAYDVTWPDYRRDLTSVRVLYTAGYPSADSPIEVVPAPIVRAMHLLIAHLYNKRDAVDDSGMDELPLGVRYMLGKYRRNLGV